MPQPIPGEITTSLARHEHFRERPELAALICSIASDWVYAEDCLVSAYLSAVSETRERQVLNVLFPMLDRDREATQALFEIIKNQPGY